MESTPQNTPYHIAFTGASQGHADAQFNLGCCYATGEGVAKDQAEAVRWYNMAAKQGHADAQFNLTSYYARCYENSEGVAKDQAAAIEWFLKAAEQGDAKAQYHLAVCYEHGHGLAMDIDAAARLFYAAANSSLNDYYSGDGEAAQDLAIEWLHSAAENGHIEAQFELATYYYDGFLKGGSERALWDTDKLKAVEWYLKAADQGHADAQFQLGSHYETMARDGHLDELDEIDYRYAVGEKELEARLAGHAEYHEAAERHSEDLLLGLGAWSRGSKMLKLDATKPAATVLWETRKDPSTMHSTPVFQDDGHFYAILNDGRLGCMNSTTGDKVWSTQEPTSKRMGNAHLVRNGDDVFIFNHTGHLILAHLTPKGYEERGRCLLVEPTAGYRAQGPLTWAHPAFANQCVFVRNDRELVCASLAAKDYTVIAGAKSQFKSSTPAGLPSGSAALAFSPDGKALAAGGSWAEGVKVIDLASNKPLPGPLPLKDFLCAVAYSPDGKWLIAAGGSEFTPARNGGKTTAQIKVFDTAASKEIGELTGHTNKVFTATISPDSHTLATGSADNTARLWDIATMKERVVLTAHTAAVMSAAFSPDGKTLATAGADHTMKLWNVTSGKMIQSIAAHEDEVRAIGFSSDGKLIATGSAGSTVRLWDATTRKEVAVMRGHRGSINCLTFSPDGKTLASGSGDETIKLWRIADAKENATLKGHRSAVTSIAFAPDARTLASAGMDDAVRVWEQPVAK